MNHLAAAKEKIKKCRCAFFDFDGVFTNNQVIVDSAGIEAVVCWRSDGLGLSKLREIGFFHQIISTETNKVVSVRAKKLGVECSYGVNNKLEKMYEILKLRNLSLDQAIYVGNDINDLDCLEVVAVPIIVADAHTDVLRDGFFKTSLCGGAGAVREVCDLIYSVLAKKD